MTNEWKKSSYCSNSGCVEVLVGDDYVALRESDQRGRVAQFTHPEWAAFVAGVKANEFDLPA